MTRCPVCCHPERPSIDAALIERRQPYAELVTRFGIAAPELKRHYTEHIGREVHMAPSPDRDPFDRRDPDIQCVEDQLAADLIGIAAWRRYVRRWRDQQHRERRGRRNE